MKSHSTWLTHLKTQVLSTPHSAHQPLTPEPPVESPLTGAEVWVPPCSAKQPETGSQEPAKLVLWFLYGFMVIAWRFYEISWDFIGV